MIDVKSLKATMSGRWTGFFGSRGRSFAKGHQPCPFSGHSESKDAFRVFDDFDRTGGAICNSCGSFSDGIALLQKIEGLSFYECLKEVDQFCNGITRSFVVAPVVAPAAVVAAPKVDPINVDVVQKQNFVLERTTPLKDGSPAKNYLFSRGIKNTKKLESIFEIDSLDYWYKAGESMKKKASLNAMIGLITDFDGEIIALHRTYLEWSDDGFWKKAALMNGDQLLPSKKQTTFTKRNPIAPAIRLFKCDEVLGIAEGIETALSASILYGMPVWSVMSAVFLPSFVPPKNVKTLVIFVDHDPLINNEVPASLAYAKNLARKMSELGIEVKIKRPKQLGDDFNDVLLNHIS